MFGLFKKKQIDVNKINEFCDWFVEHNDLINKSVLNSKNDRNKMIQYLDLVESKLAYVYSDFYHGEIHFGYGPVPKSDKWTLDLCHFNKKPLIKITSLIQENLSLKLQDKWIINIMK